MLAPWKKSYDQPRQHIKKQRHYLADKGPPSQSYGFSSSRVWMWELNYKESWVLKNWCFWTVVLEKTLESPWTARSNLSILKEICLGYSLEGVMLKLKLQYFGHLTELNWTLVLSCLQQSIHLPPIHASFFSPQHLFSRTKKLPHPSHCPAPHPSLAITVFMPMSLPITTQENRITWLT